jgi:hypothetical protein
MPDERDELLKMIAEQIEERARIESEFGEDMGPSGLPDLAELRKGLAILQRELALHQTRLMN